MYNTALLLLCRFIGCPNLRFIELRWQFRHYDILTNGLLLFSGVVFVMFSLLLLPYFTWYAVFFCITHGTNYNTQYKMSTYGYLYWYTNFRSVFLVFSLLLLLLLLFVLNISSIQLYKDCRYYNWRAAYFGSFYFWACNAPAILLMFARCLLKISRNSCIAHPFISFI